MLYLTKEDIQQAFSMSEAIQADKDALAAYNNGQTTVPLRTKLNVTQQSGESLFMPAYITGPTEALGVKIVSVYPNNQQQNLPSVPATMIVLNPVTGMVSAILDGTYLTQLRTGALQGAATDLLAPPDARIGALIGTGDQAASQLEAMLTVRNLTEVRVFDLNRQQKENFAKEMTQRFKLPIIPAATSQACVQDADIITTVTTSKKATFQADWVKAGAHINGVGSYTPEMCELPLPIIQQAQTIIVDTLDGVWQEAGDFIQPLQASLITKEIITGELGALVNATITGRQSPAAITIFKTVGSAVLDVYVANQIVTKAQALNLGQRLD